MSAQGALLGGAQAGSIPPFRHHNAPPVVRTREPGSPASTLWKRLSPRDCSHLRTVAKTSHFAHQVAVHQHAAGGERAVHKGEAGQVLHGGGHSPLHGHQLQAAELALPLLLRGRGQRSAASRRAGNLRALPGRHQQERERGSGNQKMAWEGKMRTRGGGGAKK